MRRNANRKDGIPEEFRVRTQSDKSQRAALSVLSPYNRTALGLGQTGVIVFAGADSSGPRYSSWPRVDSCKLIPFGAERPRTKMPAEDDVVDILYQIPGILRRAVTGKERAKVGKSQAGGTPAWHVGVGDPLIPGEPFLDVGQVTFYHQPAFKPPKVTPTLYVATILLPEFVPKLGPGAPLLVAVYDRMHIPRFEAYRPTQSQLEELGVKGRYFF